MARDEKPLTVKPVDDDPPPQKPAEPEVVRLATRQEKQRKERGKVPTPEPHERQLPPLPVALNPQPGILVQAPEEWKPSGVPFGIMPPANVISETPEDVWGSAKDAPTVPKGWIILASVLAILAIIWVIVSTLQSRPENPAATADAAALVAAASAEAKAVSVVDRISETIQAYFLAETPAALAAHARDPQRVLPLMESYYAENPLKPGPAAPPRLTPQPLGDRPNFWRVAVYQRGADHNLLVEIDHSGTPKVDWETHVGYQPMPWDHFVTTRPEGSLDFRVYVEPDHFHSHEFSDQNQWLSFKLTALGAEEHAFGYARRDSPVAAKVIELLAASPGKPATLVLQLGVPAGLNSPRGVVIEKVISDYWIRLDNPDASR